MCLKQTLIPQEKEENVSGFLCKCSTLTQVSATVDFDI